MFLYPDGGPFDPTTSANDSFVFSNSGSGASDFHDLRHTHATIALRAGLPVKGVSERLGHTTPAIKLSA